MCPNKGVKRSKGKYFSRAYVDLGKAYDIVNADGVDDIAVV